ncbi:IclR family transcriptional regulator [Companilactobacillus sp. HBUAS56257]|uniref:IclR family transcriptional regulator n=1 Tax=Companilactobacillus sp. HBUAS56257 TaxID=3109360 RepID=UPI002FF0D50E
MVEKKAYGTVLIKAKYILDYMMDSNAGMSLKDISNGINVSKPTVLKILETMCNQNLIRKDVYDKKYYFGSDLIGYGQRAMNDFDISRQVLPFLSKLRDETRETVHLGIEQDDKVVFLQKLESPQSVNLKSKIGGKLNLYCSAMGKALLATKTDDELDQYFSQVTLKQITPYTVTSIAELEKQISLTKMRGYSLDDKENQDEVVCVGASIKKRNKVYGAFSVSTPEYRINDQKITEIITAVINTKELIEETL